MTDNIDTKHRTPEQWKVILNEPRRTGETAFGEALKAVDKVQRYAANDPWPDVRWSDEELDFKTPLSVVVVYAALVVGVLLYAAWVALR
jgi:hypothetical protein